MVRLVMSTKLTIVIIQRDFESPAAIKVICIFGLDDYLYIIVALERLGIILSFHVQMCPYATTHLSFTIESLKMRVERQGKKR